MLGLIIFIRGELKADIIATLLSQTLATSPQIWLPLCSPVSLRALLYREPFMSDFELSQVCPNSLCALGLSDLSLCCVWKFQFCKEDLSFFWICITNLFTSPSNVIHYS